MKQIGYSATRLQKTMASACYLLVFLLTFQKLHAQSITLTLGPSIPYGLYASTDFTETSAGLATKGFTSSLLLEDNRKTKIISPLIQFTHNTNPIDEEALNTIYQYLKYKASEAYKPWNQTLLMGGVKCNYFGNNYTLFVKGALGMGWFSTYGYNIYSDSSGVIKFNTLKQNVLTFNGGVGANIYLKPNVSLSLGYDFFYAKTNFGYEKFSNAAGPVKAAVAVEVKPPFIVGNYFIGLCFRLKDLSEKNKKF